MSRKKLIAEILTELKKYDEAGMIDYRSLNRWIISEMKNFGYNIMQLTEKIVKVENGRAELPENFYSLALVVKCTPENYSFEEGCKECVQSSYFWKQRLETVYEWDNGSESHIGKDFKLIEERVVNKDATVTIRYSNPVRLRPSKNMKRDLIADKSPNLQQFRSEFEFTLQGNYLNVNFKDGDLYLQYYGLPLNEDNELEIPDNRNIQEYLIAYCKRKIFQMIWDNGEDVQNRLQFYIQESERLKGLAMTSAKMEALGSDWWKNIKRNNLRNVLKFERMF